MIELIMSFLTNLKESLMGCCGSARRAAAARQASKAAASVPGAMPQGSIAPEESLPEPELKVVAAPKEYVPYTGYRIPGSRLEEQTKGNTASVVIKNKDS